MALKCETSRISEDLVENMFREWMDGHEKDRDMFDKFVKEVSVKSSVWDSIVGEHDLVLRRTIDAIDERWLRMADAEVNRRRPAWEKEIDRMIMESPETAPLIERIKTLTNELVQFRKQIEGIRRGTRTWLDWTKSWFGRQVQSAPPGKIEQYALDLEKEAITSLSEQKELLRLVRDTHLDEKEAVFRAEFASDNRTKTEEKEAAKVELEGFIKDLGSLMDRLQKKKDSLHARAAEQTRDMDRLKKEMDSVYRQMEDMCASFHKLREDVIEQGTAAFVQLLHSFLQSRGLGGKVDPPVAIKDAVNKCLGQSKDLLLYQRMIGQLADPSIVMNMLVFHDMGTGKTCSIALCIQTLASHYLTHPLNDAGGKTVPAALVLVQDRSNIRNYQRDMESFCKLPGFMDKVNINFTAMTELNTSKWTISSKASGKVVMDVVIHKMTVQLVVSDWRKGPLSGIHGPEWSGPWEVPRVGAVLVDEAHNLFDPGEMKTSNPHHVQKFLLQLMARPDLKKFLFTGTPAYSSVRFDNLGRMLDFLRHPVASGDEIAPGSEIAEYLTNDENPRAMARNERAIHRWFHKVADGAGADDDGDERYEWISPEVKDKFQRLIEGYVSYITLQHDPSVYPRFVARWGKQIPPDPTKGLILEYRPTPDLASTGEFYAPGNTIDEPFVVVRVPSVKYNLQREKEMKLTRAKYGVHFKRYANKALPNKWGAVRDCIMMHRQYKHFVFLPVSRHEILIAFVRFFCVNKDMCGEAPGIPRFTFAEDESQSSKDAKVGEALRKLGKAERYYIMTMDIDRDAHFLLLFNHEENTHGEYFRYVFGNLSVKEGISLFATHFVHIVEPLKSGSMMNQVMRRVARFCSMKNIDIQDWMITTVIYLAYESDREMMFLKRISNQDTPVELALHAMVEGAFDCDMYQPLNRVGHCRGKSEWSASKVCHDLRGIDGDVNVEGPSAEEMCRSKKGMVGAVGPYDAWDEVLARLLVQAKVQAAPLPETAPVVVRTRMLKTESPEAFVETLLKEDSGVAAAVLHLLGLKKGRARHVADAEAKADIYIKTISLRGKPRQLLDETQKKVRDGVLEKTTKVADLLNDLVKLDGRARTILARAPVKTRTDRP